MRAHTLKYFMRVSYATKIGIYFMNTGTYTELQYADVLMRGWKKKQNKNVFVFVIFVEFKSDSFL